MFQFYFKTLTTVTDNEDIEHTMNIQYQCKSAWWADLLSSSSYSHIEEDKNLTNATRPKMSWNADPNSLYFIIAVDEGIPAIQVSYPFGEKRHQR